MPRFFALQLFFVRWSYGLALLRTAKKHAKDSDVLLLYLLQPNPVCAFTAEVHAAHGALTSTVRQRPASAQPAIVPAGAAADGTGEKHSPSKDH